MPLQGNGAAAHPSEVAGSDAETIDFTGESDAIASHRPAAVRRPPQRHVREDHQ